MYREKLMPHLNDDELAEFLKKKYNEDLLSLSAIAKECNVDYRSIHKYFDRFGIEKRSKSEGMKLRFARMSDAEKQAHVKHANKAIKEKEWSIREQHNKARGKVKTKMSKWEQWFAKKLIDNDLYYFLYAYPEGAYNIDFAFPVEKIAIEIDSRWHSKKETKDRDIRKDAYLEAKGWTVFRLKASSYFRKNDSMTVAEAECSLIISSIKERL